MKPVTSALLLLVVTGLLTACNKVSHRKTAGGMPYQLYRGKGVTPIRSGDYIKLHFTQKIGDSTYFTTNGKLPIYFRVHDRSMPYDISEMWTLLKKGDSAVVTQVVDSLVAKSPAKEFPPHLKKGDLIKSYITILDVFNNDSLLRVDETKEKAAYAVRESVEIEKYLAAKNIKAEKTPSGAFVEILAPGDGPLADSGKYVSVLYRGTSWSGVIFDTNMDSSFNHTEPFSLVTGTGAAIKGFDEGVMKLRKGGSGKIYIPSLLAYGTQPQSPDIKPLEHLIFEIKVLDVQDQEPAPTNVPPVVKRPPTKKN